MKEIRYIAFLPGGNKTALVLGDKYDASEKKIINDAIMAADPEIEQVGFVQDVGDNPEGLPAFPTLDMAGGEFCGNATRSAAYYYLQGREGEMVMTVSGGNRVACGVHKAGEAWCEIPVGKGNCELVAEGIWQVELSGITHLVLEPETAAPYLEDRDFLKIPGLALIEKFHLNGQEAAGAIFLERLAGGRLKINPIVWVRDIESLFYETACGSGTVATAIVLANKVKGNVSAEIVQPSGMSIRAEVESDGETVTRAVISGPVETDLRVHTLRI